MRFIATLLFTAVALAACTTTPPRSTEPVSVKVLAINDFHGNLKPPRGGIRIKDPADAAKTIDVPAGGTEHLATAVAQLRAKNPNHIFVAAGDLIGASPLLSALFRDEPTIESLGLMGLEVTAVGNHEFDRGSGRAAAHAERRLPPGRWLQGAGAVQGRELQVPGREHGRHAHRPDDVPGYHVKRFEGIPVAFIGLTLKDTPNIVVPSGVAGLRFDDEAETVNELVPELQRQGIEAIVRADPRRRLPDRRLQRVPGHQRARSSTSSRSSTRRSTWSSAATPTAPTTAASTAASSPAPTSTAPSSARSTWCSTRRPATCTSARADNLIVRTDRFAKDAAQTQLIEVYETARGAAGQARRRPHRRAADARRKPGRRNGRSARSWPMRSSRPPAPRPTAARRSR